MLKDLFNEPVRENVYYTVFIDSDNMRTLFTRLHEEGFTWITGHSLFNFTYPPYFTEMKSKYISFIWKGSDKHVFISHVTPNVLTFREKGPKMTNEQVLATFLKEHRKYSAFKKYTQIPNLYTTLRCVEARNVLIMTFNWSSTKEGYDYWRKCDTKWTNLVDKFNIQGKINLDKLPR